MRRFASDRVERARLEEITTPILTAIAEAERILDATEPIVHGLYATARGERVFPHRGDWWLLPDERSCLADALWGFINA